MTSSTTQKERTAFYGAAVLGLRALDARESTPRRFGSDAEVRWRQFAGALGPGDRIDILLRDAAGTWGAAFSPSECFGFFGLADDEPFGPDWGGLDDSTAKRLLDEPDAPATLDRLALGLGVEQTDVPVPYLSPSTKLLVAGGAAIVAVAKVFARDQEEARALSWTDQVVVVADRGSFRQLAGLAAVVLGARGRTALVRTTEGAETGLRAAGFGHLDAVLVSPDAEPEAAEFARSAGGR